MIIPTMILYLFNITFQNNDKNKDGIYIFNSIMHCILFIAILYLLYQKNAFWYYITVILLSPVGVLLAIEVNNSVSLYCCIILIVFSVIMLLFR